MYIFSSVTYVEKTVTFMKCGTSYFLLELYNVAIVMICFVVVCDHFCSVPSANIQQKHAVWFCAICGM